MKYNKFKIYLYLCISVFFLLLAFTLYYSLGYKYDPLTGKSYQTGAIVLRITPKDVSIFQDEKELEKNSSFTDIFSDVANVKIENLKAKTYSIKVSRDGYNDWQKNIQIDPTQIQVEKFENIVLLKKEYASQPAYEDVTLPSSEKVWPLPKKNKIVFQGSVGQETGVFLLDLNNESKQRILDNSQLNLMGELQNIEWSRGDDRLIIRAGGNLFVIDLSDGNKVYLISNETIKNAFLHDPSASLYISGKFIIYSENNSVYSLNYTTKEAKELKNNTGNFYAYQDNLYFFKTEQGKTPELFVASLGDPARQNQIGAMTENFDTQTPFSIEKSGNFILVFSNGSLFLTGKDIETKKINSGVSDAYFFQSGKRILYYNDNEIWIYYTEDKTSQPAKSKNENELLTRFSDKLSNIRLYSDEEHIFYQENTSFKFAEFDGRDSRNTFNVMENPAGQNIFYLSGKNLIYFIRDNRLYKVNLAEA